MAAPKVSEVPTVYKSSMFVQPLCMDNYTLRFSTLLFLEEIQREIDIRQFDMTMVSSLPPPPQKVT